MNRDLLGVVIMYHIRRFGSPMAGFSNRTCIHNASHRQLQFVLNRSFFVALNFHLDRTLAQFPDIRLMGMTAEQNLGPS